MSQAIFCGNHQWPGQQKKRSDLNLYLIASFFALLRMVIPSAKCHANQCKTFRRATAGLAARVVLTKVMRQLVDAGEWPGATLYAY
ncbi:hypothetical protein EJ309_22400 [Salmonella enterica]|nr:hypothetical protein [Salmonella enterica]